LEKRKNIRKQRVVFSPLIIIYEQAKHIGVPKMPQCILELYIRQLQFTTTLAALWKQCQLENEPLQ
jgi:hypothetical protein